MQEIPATDEEIAPLDVGDGPQTPTHWNDRRKTMRKILVHQMSSLELPVDPKSGLVKLHYWY